MGTHDPTPPDTQKQIAAFRKRLIAAALVLEDRSDEGALEEVAHDLRDILSDLEGDREGEVGDEAGLGVWMRGQPAKNRYLLAGGVVALVVVVMAVVMLRGTSAAARAARYDEAFSRAGTMLSGGKNAEAAQAYREALTALPDNPQKSADAYNNLGWALQQQGQLDEAIQSYQAALKLMPNLALAANNLAAAQRVKAQRNAPAAVPGPP